DEGLEREMIAIGPPVLGQLDGRARELARILFELAFEALEQREGIGGRAREAADDVALAQAADLLGVGLHNGLADRYLAVAADRAPAALPDPPNCSSLPPPRFRR